MSLYVGNLPEGIDDQSFKMLFEGSGNVLSATCTPEKMCGYVKYSTKEEAQAVIDAMNGYDFGGTQLVVSFAEQKGGQAGKGNSWDNGWGKGDSWQNGGKGDSWQKGGKGDSWQKGGNGWNNAANNAAPAGPPQPSDNLYVKQLPVGFDQATCEALFNGYGKVMQCKVMNYGNSSSALIRMESTEMAQWIVENLHGNIPEGLDCAIEVRYADGPAQKAVRMQQWGKGTAKGRPSPYGVISNLKGKGKGKVMPGDQTNLYVKDLPGSADDLYVYKVFSPFGALESIFVKPSPDGTWAIAFVKYRTEEAAASAIQGLTNCLLPDGSMLKVSVKT
eukprot:CAMPEP_0169411056 /NCGR_PEP_ID=MMETSP1017-20121227/60099_1 /TAXON_ID=342587 /ORGANISM="Karlodinium micrum, Strain CCMP2283" /LENGTH=331 /DNA_ID=CAMNT_0009518339 /DNA_START=44 /DNA_END=1039 /DNA_ORIENTATION=-